ncbi:MAG: hypothetical protein IJB26_06765 [Clostridia bacterium]|nr:hypothetical protein [Clostridia bacterium]
MNHQPLYEKEDIVINFRDMLVHILRRWRSIVIVVLVAALLAGGYQYLKDRRAYEDKLTAQESGAVTITLTGASLANANQALQYQKTYEAQANYNRHSLLMQIDPSEVNTVTLSYTVTGAKSYAAAALYQTHLNNLAMYEDAAAKIAPNNDPSYIMELVSATLQYESGTLEAADHAILNVKIIAPNKDMCAIIANEVKTHIATLQSTVSAALGAHECRLAAQTEQMSADQSLKTTQQNNLNNCNTLRNNLKSTRDALTDREKAYVDQVLAANNGTVSTPTPPSVSVKMVILGLAAGLVLMIGIYGLGYVFSRKLKSREDFAERFGLFVFGQLTPPTDRETLALIEKQLLLSTRHNAGETPTICVIGCGTDVRENATLGDIKTDLAENKIAVELLLCPLYDASALEKVAAADAVVLAETLDASTYDDIYRELDLCDRLGRPVLGAFILK